MKHLFYNNSTLGLPRLVRFCGRLARGVLALSLLAWGADGAHGSTAYGTLNNFDVVNDTGGECHGFEIEIEDIHSQDVTRTYNWNHYGTPKIIEDDSDPQHPRVRIRYESAKDANGGWAAYTAVPDGPIAPTDGHRFTDPSVNFGGEHFGVGYRGGATNITYHWLVDNGSGVLVRGPKVMVATPRFTYVPGGGGVPGRVQAVIQAPPAPPVREFGPASWVKEIRTTSHNNHEVKLRDLVSDDPDDDDDKNWRNGEPDEVEVEWQLLQEEFNSDDGGANGELEAEPEDLNEGDEVVTRRYEFYKYVGPIDNESWEAKADKVGEDGIHGEGVKTINGIETDLSTVVVVGEYLGAQMSAFDVDAPVGLIEHVQDGVVDEAYPTRTVVIAGSALFTSTNWGNLPPGMSFNRVSGELSGTPTEAGVFQFTVEAKAGDDPVVRRTYTLTVADGAVAAAALPPRATVDTVASPLNGGSTSGDGTYLIGTESAVTATPAAGFVFVHWTDNGQVVSDSASYTFTHVVHRSLTAHFRSALPRLAHARPQPGVLALSWPTNAPDAELQQNSDLTTTNWVTVTNGVSVVETNNRVNIAPLTGSRFFRLIPR